MGLDLDCMNVQYIEISQLQANFSVFTPLLLALSRRGASGEMHSPAAPASQGLGIGFFDYKGVAAMRPLFLLVSNSPGTSTFSNDLAPVTY